MEGHAVIWLGRESVRRFLLLGVEVVLIFVVVVSLEVLLTRRNLRFDLTPTRKHSLSLITQKALGSLTQAVEVTAFYRRGERSKYDQLLGLMAQETPLLGYRLFDLDRAPGLAQQYGITTYGSTVVETKQDRITIPVTDEERVLNAILRISQPVKTIYFLSGHGERDPIDMQERTGYGVVRRVLETENYRVRSLLLRRTGRVPQDADLVVVSGPKEELSTAELDVLSAYFSAGGNALFMIDPYSVPGLCQYLAQFGFILDDGVVVDTQTQLSGGDPLMPAIPTFAEEVFPRQLRSPPMMPVTRPVRVRDDRVQAFAFSGPESWAQKSRERIERGDLAYRAGEDQHGPVPVAAVATVDGQADGRSQGKIVVYGDSDFVDNFYCRIPGNVDFFMNTVGWLLGRQELVSIGRSVDAPAARRVATPAQSVYLSQAQTRRFFWTMVVLEPGLIFLAGMVVFFQRRRKR
jgi:ABC-type uncharacterized transport system involved in gliding motility auxiliary subunit